MNAQRLQHRAADSGRFARRGQDERPDHDNQFGPGALGKLAAEEKAQVRHLAEDRHLRARVGDALLNESAQGDGQAVLGHHGRGGGLLLDRVNGHLGNRAVGVHDGDGAAAGNHGGPFQEDAQRHRAVGVDIGRNEQRGADVFQHGDWRAGNRGRRPDAARNDCRRRETDRDRRGDAAENAADFVVGRHDERRGQLRDPVRGFQELHARESWR